MRSNSLPSDDTFPHRDANTKRPRKSKLPPNAPDIIARHTITIDNPDDILFYAHSAREKQFQDLVRRYISQLLFGCQNPFCTTPTCFSYQKRNAKSPLRKFTPLSARALACSLASEKDPEAALCHNAPIRGVEPGPSSTKTGTARKKQAHNELSPGERREGSPAKRRTRSSRSDGENIPLGLSVTWRETETPARRSSQPGNRTSSSERSGQSKPLHDVKLGGLEGSSALGEDPPRKDSKSFTQALFDTMSLRMLSWLPSLRSANDASLQDLRAPKEAMKTDYAVVPTIDRSLRIFSEDASQTRHQQPEARAGKPDGPGDQSASLEGTKLLQSRDALNKPMSTVEAQGLTNSADLNMWTNRDSEENSKGSEQRILGHRYQSTDSEVEYPKGPRHSEHHPIGHASHELPLVTNNQVFPTGTHSSDKATRDAKSNSLEELDEIDDQRDKTPPQRVHPRPKYQAQTLSRLNRKILEGLCTMVHQSRLVESSYKGRIDAETSEAREMHDADLSSFIQQSVYFVLKDPSRLHRSFLFNDAAAFNITDASISNVPLIREPGAMHEIFQCSYRIHQICSAERIWDSLWIVLGHLFVPPPDLARSLKHGKKHSGRSKPDSSTSLEYQSKSTLPTPGQNYVPDIEAARICILTLFALAIKTLDFRYNCEPGTSGACLRWSREIGRRSLPKQLQVAQGEIDAYYKLMDTLDNASGTRLIGRLTMAISNRVAFSAIRKSKPRDPLMAGLRGTFKNSSVLRTIWAAISTLPSQGFGSKYSVAQTTLAWANTLIADEWDGKVQVQRSSMMGGSLQLLASMYEARRDLDLEPSDFYIRLFSDRLDPLDIPAEWLGFSPNNKVFHLLSFPFLFLPSALVQYFRAINHASMLKAFEKATAKSHLVKQLLRGNVVPIHDETRLLLRLRPTMATFLVLNVRRDNVLTDAINLLWRRERRELLRPLKIKMGMEIGEMGVDVGGVQQEFFRILFAEALNTDFGMFTIDERTRMTWYQPASREPLYKFEMLGLLMSLAVYNSITLSVTFPLAFYRKLLGLKVKKLEHIADGWTELAKGLQELLTWSDGDVADVFLRTYEFSYEAYGSRVDVDMEKIGRESPWPRGKRSKGKDKAKSASFDFSSEIQGALQEEPINGNRRPSAPILTPPEMDGEPSTSHVVVPPIEPGISTPASHVTVEPETSSYEASLVTNANREQFVKDYIFWLADKSIRQQHEAFLRGFLVCLDRKAISIFTPEALKAVIEGRQEIDIDGLERVARYSDGFSQDDRAIRWFWEVVRDMDPEQHRQLLEFVTASDRLPVQGVEGLVFVIHRSGEDDGQLPTSSTCFGRLLLPAYSSKEVLKDRLTWAIQDTRGFFMP